MYAKHLSDYIIKKDESIYKAHWLLHKNRGIVIVIDENEKFKGVICNTEIQKTYYMPNACISDICNPKPQCIYDSSDNYSAARNIFAEMPSIQQIPVINADGDVIDLMTRSRCFYREYYNTSKLPRMYYAHCIWEAAIEARELGYDSFSVIEFGVAGGSGLVNCEFHAQEISRLLGINIEVYGFDLGSGLPFENMGYKDMIHFWQAGHYPMDLALLKERLQFAKLVIGDISETTNDFFEKYSPAPIGAIMVDVDYYSSTLPILKFLENTQNNFFLPRIHIYFDDIFPEYEFSGENLAIKEFNARNEYIKLSPEHIVYSDYRKKIKVCHRFLHEKYNTPKIIHVREVAPGIRGLPLDSRIF